MVAIIFHRNNETIDLFLKKCTLRFDFLFCNAKQGQIGDSCNSLSARGVDDRSRQSILQAHNSLRDLVASGQERRGTPGPQPPASNMQIMVKLSLIFIAASLTPSSSVHAHASHCRVSVPRPSSSPFHLFRAHALPSTHSAAVIRAIAFRAVHHAT